MTFINISGIKNPDKLKCQEIKNFCFNQKLPLERSFLVYQELWANLEIVNNSSTVEFILGCCQSLPLDEKESYNDMIQSWAGIWALISSAEVPEMQVGFLFFIPKPVTESPTVHTSMLNFVKMANWLDQVALPLFYNEGDFRIVFDIYLQKKDEFCNIISVLGGFHTT